MHLAKMTLAAHQNKVKPLIISLFLEGEPYQFKKEILGIQEMFEKKKKIRQLRQMLPISEL